MEQLTFDFLDNSTYLEGGLHAKTSPSPGSEKAVKKEAEQEVPLCGSFCDWQKNFVQEFCCGKTLSGRFPQMGEETSMNLFKPLMRSGICVRGEFLTHNSCEHTAHPLAHSRFRMPSPKEDVVCGLSQVLEEMSPSLRKYFLSPLALQGILRRAKSRGKTLPPLLKTAIEAMLEWWGGRNYGIGNGQINCACTPAEEASQTLDSMHDTQKIMQSSSSGLDVASTISADGTTQTGQDYKSNSVIEAFNLPSMNSNVMKSPNPNSGVKAVDVFATLDSTPPSPHKNQGGDMIVECFENHPNDSRIASSGDCVQTLTQRIGTGGGQSSSSCWRCRRR